MAAAGAFTSTTFPVRQVSGNGRDAANVGCAFGANSGHSFASEEKKLFIPRNLDSRTSRLERYLSKMGSPVYGCPAVEGVLHGEVSRVRGSLEERAQGADISIPARPVEGEAAV